MNTRTARLLAGMISAAAVLAASGATLEVQPAPAAADAAPAATHAAQGSAAPAGASAQVTPGSASRPTPKPRPRPRWRPRVGQAWQWQLTGPVNRSVNVPIYDIDLFTNPKSVVTALHRAHRRVICYVNVGASEDFRPDAGRFPDAVQGSPNGWPGERWLDIRRIDVLGPIMARRFDQCRAKGFDAVEPDNVDGYSNDTGFPLTAADQLRYNRYIARLAHARGLSVALKNDLDQVPALVASFDFAISEQCFQYDECDQLRPFLARHKAVLEVEYALQRAQFCRSARSERISAMVKRLDLDAWRVPC